MKRQLIAVGLAILLGLGGFTFIPEIVSATNIGDSHVFLTQQTSVTCTLASATMAVRRKALLADDPQWSSITEESMRNVGWGAGLSHKFTYRTSRYAYTITHKNFDMNSGMSLEEKKEKIIDLLNKHPEGLAIYARDGYNGFHQGNHCILLTRYEDGVFYCGDPASKKTKKEMPIKYARKVTIANFASYWYVSHVEDLKNKGKTNLVNAYASLDDESCIYDGTEKRPTATIMYKDKTLIEGEDYTLQYEGDRIKAGNYKIIIQGINDYCGKLTKTFKIKNRDISDAEVALSSDKFLYDGGLQTPGALVRYDCEILLIGANYNIEYEDSVEIGKYKVTIYGTNDYDGIKHITYYVLPDKVNNPTISNNTLSFSKVDGSPQYEITYKNKNEENWQSVTVDNTSYTFKKPGDYEIKVRAFKNDAYGSYSKIITAHIA